MNFVDRRSTNPGKHKATWENGDVSYFTLERADNPIVSGTPLNAATFNAMVNELRANSDARNLLDNSNFAAPVNQRGSAIYVGGAYTIDRWYTTSKLDVEVVSGGVTLVCNPSATTRYGFTQYIAPEKIPAPGAPITVAYKDVDNDVIYVESGTMPETGSVNLTSTTDVGIRVTSAADGARVSVMIPPDTSFDLEWIALYEGTFSADNLPTYRPKDFSAELMECMRYYQVRSTSSVNPADLRPTMRATPTVAVRDDGLYGYSADM